MTPTAEVRFTRLYEPHYADVIAYCGRRVNRAEVEDVTNEVFVVLWRRIDRFDDEMPLPWLYGVAYRTIANRRRSTQRRFRLVEKLRGVRRRAAEAAEDVVVRRERDRVVIDAMSRLSPTDPEHLEALFVWVDSITESPGAVECETVSEGTASCTYTAVDPTLERLTDGDGTVEWRQSFGIDTQGLLVSVSGPNTSLSEAAASAHGRFSGWLVLNRPIRLASAVA